MILGTPSLIYSSFHLLKICLRVLNLKTHKVKQRYKVRFTAGPSVGAVGQTSNVYQL